LRGIFINCRGPVVYVLNAQIGLIPASATHRPEEEETRMSHPIRNMIMLSATVLALIAAPVLMNQTALSDLQAIAKDKGNGGGGGGGGGNGNGGGSENSNAGGNGGGGGGGSEGQSNKSEGKGKKVATTEGVTTTTKAAKTKNLNGQLAGLNSLKRNINGLMNSSSPRMVQLRAFVENSAALETAAAALEVEDALLDELQIALDDVIDTATADIVPFDDSTFYENATLEQLNDRLEDLADALEADPDDQLAIDEQAALVAALDEINGSDEFAAVTAQEEIVEGLADEVAELELLTTEEALKDALIAAANKNRVAEAGAEAYLTPEIMAWATARIEALTDDLLAQQ
jgi:hypothetical protein